MEYSLEKRLNAYYTATSAAYERWGGDSSALHLGYFDNPHALEHADPRLIHDLHDRSHHDMLLFMKDFIAPRKGEVVLDAGCGTGSLAPMIKATESHYIGLNIADTQLLTLQRKQFALSGTGNLVKGDYANIPLANRSVDKVVFFESLSHASDVEQVLCETHRILKDDGEICVADPMLDVQLLDKHQQHLLEMLNHGMVLNVDHTEIITTTLQKLHMDISHAQDLTLNVLPSMKLAAISASQHAAELDVSEVIAAHREATLACHELMKQGIIKYMVIKARKKPI